MKDWNTKNLRCLDDVRSMQCLQPLARLQSRVVCSKTVTEYFADGTEPEEKCDLHRDCGDL
ncbi:MAG: hypothetical protein ACLUD0_20390 [Eubacterium ramulus]